MITIAWNQGLLHYFDKSRHKIQLNISEKTRDEPISNWGVKCMKPRHSPNISHDKLVYMHSL